MTPIVSHLSKKDYELIGEYAKFKGWRYGLADSGMRVAYFYDKDEKRIRKTFGEMHRELNPGGTASDGQHSRGR